MNRPISDVVLWVGPETPVDVRTYEGGASVRLGSYRGDGLVSIHTDAADSPAGALDALIGHYERVLAQLVEARQALDAEAVVS